MKTSRVLLLLVATLSLPGRGVGQIISTEPIDETIFFNEPFEQFYPNVFDLDHPKLLTLTGFASTPAGPVGATTFLNVQFDWLLASGGTQLSTAVTIPVGGEIPTPIGVTFTIPFCPERVSLHLSEEPTGLSSGQAIEVTWGVVVDADFTHECLVPETDALIPAGVLLTGMTVWGWRRRARKA